jgi:hypothetical protein
MEPYNIEVEDNGAGNPDVRQQMANKTESNIDEPPTATLLR